MIFSTSSNDGTIRFGTRPHGLAPELISAQNIRFLQSELARQPKSRPEVVARGRALAADPAYPPVDILRRVAAQILASPDLSEDNS